MKKRILFPLLALAVLLAFFFAACSTAKIEPFDFDEYMNSTLEIDQFIEDWIKKCHVEEPPSECTGGPQPPPVTPSSDSNSGDQSSDSNSGDQSSDSNSGDQSSDSNSGSPSSDSNPGQSNSSSSNVTPPQGNSSSSAATPTPSSSSRASSSSAATPTPSSSSTTTPTPSSSSRASSSSTTTPTPSSSSTGSSGGGDSNCAAGSTIVDATACSSTEATSTGLVCFKVEGVKSGWGLSNTNGRTCSVNGGPQFDAGASNRPALNATTNYINCTAGQYSYFAIYCW